MYEVWCWPPLWAKEADGMALPLYQADNIEVRSIRLQPSIINQVTIKIRWKQDTAIHSEVLRAWNEQWAVSRPGMRRTAGVQMCGKAMLTTIQKEQTDHPLSDERCSHRNGVADEKCHYHLAENQQRTRSSPRHRSMPEQTWGAKKKKNAAASKFFQLAHFCWVDWCYLCITFLVLGNLEKM